MLKPDSSIIKHYQPLPDNQPRSKQTKKVIFSTSFSAFRFQLFLLTLLINQLQLSYAFNPSSSITNKYKKSQNYQTQRFRLKAINNIGKKNKGNDNLNKLYIVQNQSIIIIPQFQFSQSQYTEYVIEGQLFQEQQALQVVREYEQFPFKKQFQSQDENENENENNGITDFFLDINDVPYLYYLSQKNILYFATIEYQIIKVYAQKNISSLLLIGKGLLAISPTRCLIWGRSQVIFAQKTQQFLQQSPYIRTIKISLETEIEGKSIKRCQAYSSINFLCFTNDRIFMLNIKEQQLQVEHIYTLEHNCLVNVIQIEANIIALCDCQNGCYNYQVTSESILQERDHIENKLGTIVSMQIIENSLRGTVIVAGQTIIVLYQWTPLQIVQSDSFTSPEIEDLKLSKAQGSFQYILITYSNKTYNQTIICWYDVEQYSYQTFNIILNNLNIKLFDQVIYQVTINMGLQVRWLNPYNIKVDYSQQQRVIKIRAYESDSKNQTNSLVMTQQIDYQIYPANIGQIYLRKQLPEIIEISNTDQFEIFLDTLYVWGNKGSYQVRITSNQPKLLNLSAIQKTFIVKTMQDHRILSLYSLLPCVKMYPASLISFQRIMLSPNNLLYIETCGNKDYLTDYLCTLIEIKQNNIYIGKPKVNEIYRIIQIKTESYLWHFRTVNQTDQYLVATKDLCFKIQLNSNTYLQNPEQITLLDETTLIYFIREDNNIGSEIVSRSYKLIVYQLQKTDNTFVSLIRQFININVYDFQIDTKSMELILTFQNITKKQPTIQILKMSINKLLSKNTEENLNYNPNIIKHHYQIKYQNPSIFSAQKTFITKIYKFYLFLINQTHFCKYSTTSLKADLLFCRDIYGSSTPVIQKLMKVQITGQYLLIIFTNSYKLMDLEETSLSVQIGSKTLLDANQKVYDLILSDSTIIMGIGNIVRSYSIQSGIRIEPFPLRIDLIRQYLNIQIKPIPILSNFKGLIPTLRSVIFIIYQSSLLQYQGKRVKLLHVPYHASQFYLQIYQTMFLGPVFQYYIFDTFDYRIILKNHFEQLGTNNNISTTMQQQINSYNYYLLLAGPTQIQLQTLAYTNGSHLIMVDLLQWNTSKVQLIEGQINETISKFEYFLHIPTNKKHLCYVLVGQDKIGFINSANQYFQVNLKDSIILKYSIDQGDILYLLVQESNPTGLSAGKISRIYYSNLTGDPLVLVKCYRNQTIKLMEVSNNIIIYGYIASDNNTYLLCYDQKNSFLTNTNSDERCVELVSIIDPKYYVKDVHTFDQISLLSFSATQQKISILLTSASNNAFFLQLTLDISKSNMQQKDNWQTTGCYVGLFNGQKYNRLISTSRSFQNNTIQYLLMEYYSFGERILVYYVSNKFKQGSTNQCSQIVNQISLETNQSAVLSGGFLYKQLEVYQINKKIFLLLNYTSPPPVSLIMIHSKNSEQQELSLGFYAKFIFDSEETHSLLYSILGFSVVILTLISIKILSCLCDKGIIKWNSTFSSDDDQILTHNSLAITQAFNNKYGTF